jgi:lipid A 4'-phosphatase
MLRIAAGGHFFTDVVFAGVFMFLLAWTSHGLIYRWRPIRMTREAVERPLAQVGEALRSTVAALARRMAGRSGQRS